MKILTLLLLCLTPALAHNGPPFPLFENKRVGPCIAALWTHPDVGTGTFFVILDPSPGGRIPDDVKVQIGVRPVTGRLPEKLYTATRENLRGQVQFGTAVDFDADEMWKVRLIVSSKTMGSGESMAEVEATPTGLGRWDLLWYVSPFLGAGFLWIRALGRKRKRAKC
jgi:hypothetical protein